MGLQILGLVSNLSCIERNTCNIITLHHIFLDENTKDAKITASSETILHGLKKYTNYSMEVLAYTSGGDGVRTTPIHCQTEQDGNSRNYLI